MSFASCAATVIHPKCSPVVNRLSAKLSLTEKQAAKAEKAAKAVSGVAAVAGGVYVSRVTLCYHLQAIAHQKTAEYDKEESRKAHLSAVAKVSCVPLA
jgi:hypothetical protein